MIKKITIQIFTLLATTGCSINRAESDRMLDARAKYADDSPLDVHFVPTDEKMRPSRTSPVTADIWVHPAEMATGDYFLGGWIRSVVKEAHWSTRENSDETFKPVTKPDAKKEKKPDFTRSRKS